MLVKYEELEKILKKIFLDVGVSEDDATLLTKTHTKSSALGVESHGVNRVPRFINYVNDGLCDINAKLTLVGHKGAFKNYDGGYGIGVKNATLCAKEAIDLAKDHGIGIVALRNTTHWMRGGSYSELIAENGYVGICFTNTESCMPLWGSSVPSVGNNPLGIAIPRKEGNITLDMAMSQYAYGKIGTYRLKGEQLPFDGGYDLFGNLTKDPKSIEDSKRILPTGMWKGSGFALALDMVSAILSNGKSGTDMDIENKGCCVGCSQVFIAIDPYLFNIKEDIDRILNNRYNAAKAAKTAEGVKEIFIPGDLERVCYVKSLKEGVHVDDQIWEQIKMLEKGIYNLEDISAK